MTIFLACVAEENDAAQYIVVCDGDGASFLRTELTLLKTGAITKFEIQSRGKDDGVRKIVFMRTGRSEICRVSDYLLVEGDALCIQKYLDLIERLCQAGTGHQYIDAKSQSEKIDVVVSLNEHTSG